MSYLLLTFWSVCASARNHLQPSVTVLSTPSFLLAEPKYVSCVRLDEILAEVSRDRLNRFLLRERYTPKALFEDVSGSLI